MRTKLLYLCFLVMAVCLCLMFWLTGDKPAPATDDDALTLAVEPRQVAASDFIYGYVGDGTGMSCIEFVTLAGDTMLLSKTSEYTGREMVALGSMHTEETSLYAVKATDNGEAAGVIVNMTELRARWQHFGQGFVLTADSVAMPVGKDAPKYTRWLLADDNMVLFRDMHLEGGVTEVADTLHIVSLSPDTLVLGDAYGDERKYWH